MVNTKRIWSPEEYNGPKVRRNTYEELLQRVEEERFEVDMAIERNASAMRKVEPYAEEVSMLRNNEENDGQPIGRLQYQLRTRSLDAKDLASIARLYGDDNGEIVLQLLAQNPMAVLPIVFTRLKQKDADWRAARADITKVWRTIQNEANLKGSLDVTCYFYRREIERSYNLDTLLEECKRARYYVKHPRKQNHHAALTKIKPTFLSTTDQLLLFQSHIRIPITSSPQVHKYALECLFTNLNQKNSHSQNHQEIVSSHELEKATRIICEFICPWFHLPSHYLSSILRQHTRPDKSTCLVKCK